MGNPVKTELEPGLYLIATPLGTARDITLRALDLLAAADVLAAEDTRSLRKLMDIHGVALGARPLVSYHDHNAATARPRLMQALEQGKSVLYASEAGTPMISDPGYDLARDVVENGHRLISAPGPSAVITALTLSGLATGTFFFAGFLPKKTGKRKTALKGLRNVPGTLIFYEAPKRLASMLTDASEVLGGHRKAAVCREISKKFEETLRGDLGALAELVSERSIKGEIVALIEQEHLDSGNKGDLDSALKEALAHSSVRDAADEVAARLGMKRRIVYQRALEIGRGEV